MTADNIVETYRSLGLQADWRDKDGNVWASPRKKEHIEHILRIRHVVEINLPSKAWTNETLERVLEEMPELRAMKVGCSYVRGSKFAKIVNLQGLNKLFVHGLVLEADSAVESVSRCMGLKKLTFMNSLVSPDGLSHLARLQDLSSLTFERCVLGTLGWEQIGAIKSLENLVVTYEDLPYQCLASISGLSKLSTLCLNKCVAITPGFEFLSRLGSLRVLRLDHVGMFSKSLSGITKLSSLRRLSLEDTPISRRDVEDIRKALPYCQIEYSPCPELPPTEVFPPLKEPPEKEWR